MRVLLTVPGSGRIIEFLHANVEFIGGGRETGCMSENVKRDLEPRFTFCVSRPDGFFSTRILRRFNGRRD